ncbi:MULTISPECIES: hypothetical protein [Bradyrhizobium]|uniref:hypothetical protein n=1 Tax=Bradyrhizobium TaxID=374 RepID=UPI0004AFEAB2|nr:MULTISPECIES: hypothetical protein [Bradyrhizobium]UWU93655.1 hypothetical protein N2604_07135 [Bradyrhizobium sp. CB1015]
MKLPPAVWNWCGGLYWRARRRRLRPHLLQQSYGPPIYGDVVDTPVFLAGGQIGYNWQKNG